MEPMLDTAKSLRLGKNLRLDKQPESHSSRGKPTSIIMLKEHSNKMTPNDVFLYP